MRFINPYNRYKFVFDNVFRGSNLIVNGIDPYGAPIDVTPIRNIKILGKGDAKEILAEQDKSQPQSGEELLLAKATRYVEENISRPDLSVEEMARQLGMSRAHFYKRLMVACGKTPIEFIRFIRLKRAAELLKDSRYNVSEVAYQVGFNNPRYFTKYFSEAYGIVPSLYQEKYK